MPRRSCRFVAATAMAAFVTQPASHAGGGASFVGLGHLPGGASSSQANDVTPDGTVVADPAELDRALRRLRGLSRRSQRRLRRRHGRYDRDGRSLGAVLEEAVSFQPDR